MDNSNRKKTLLLHAATEMNLRCAVLSESVRLTSYRLYDSIIRCSAKV